MAGLVKRAIRKPPGNQNLPPSPTICFILCERFVPKVGRLGLLPMVTTRFIVARSRSMLTSSWNMDHTCISKCLSQNETESAPKCLRREVARSAPWNPWNSPKWLEVLRGTRGTPLSDSKCPVEPVELPEVARSAPWNSPKAHPAHTDRIERRTEPTEPKIPN